MKVTKKDILLLIALAGVLVAVCTYFLVYQPLNEKTAAMETENATLQTRVDELQVLKDNEQKYLSDTAAMKAENDEILNRFPADVRSEDMIMLATQMGYAAPVIVVDATMEDPEDLYHIGARAAAAAAEEAAAAAAAAQAAADPAATDPTAVDPAAADPAVAPAPAVPEAEQIMYGRKMVISFRGTYEAMKNCIEYIYGSTDRRIVGAVNATYEPDTGLVAVKMGASMYYVTGTGKEYVEPSIPFIPQGTDDIFGALDTLPDAAAALAGSTGNAEGEGEED